MADITRLLRLATGGSRQVDLTTNTPVVLSVKIGGVTNTELTKSILDNLVALQNGSDFANGTNSHTHDGRYFTEAELSSATSSSGSDLIGDDNTYTNFTPSAATIKGALVGIDSALSAVSSSGRLRVPVRLANNSGNLSLTGTPTIDGVSTAAGNRVLVNAQTLPAQNGVYVVAAGAWSRATDLDSTSEAGQGVTYQILEGTLYTGAEFFISTSPATLGVDSLVFSEQGLRKDLSNLASPTSITQDLLTAVGGVNLGSAANPWNILTLADSIFNIDGNGVIDVNNRQLNTNTGSIALDFATDGIIETFYNVIPNTDSSDNIGSPTKKYAAGYFVALKDSDDNSAIEISNSNRTLNAVGGAVVVDFSGPDLDLNANKIINLADPTSAQDGATKAYVDAVALGLRPKASVRVATLVAGTLATSFENGDVIDGITLVTGDRILIKNQAAPADNGIYTVNVSGSPTRATDFDSLSPIDEINGAYTFVREGTQAGQGWVVSTTVVTIGTSAINFVYFNDASTLVGGDMITVTGATISVDLATSSGLESTNPGNNAGQLRIKLEASNPSLKFSGSNELGVKFDAAGALLSGASGVAVQVDGSTIEISSNALRVKDAGITLAKLASNSVDENKIVSTSFNAAGAVTGGSGSKIAVQVDASSIEISSNALRIKTTAYDQSTITGGGGSAAAVAGAPQLFRTLVAGEAFAANTSFLVRWAVSGETAGRVYKADKDASVSDLFYAFGIALSTGAVSAGGNIKVISAATHTLGSSDTPFSSGDIGKAVFLTSAGAFSITAPSAANEAVLRIGMVQEVSKIDVMPQFIGIN